MRGYLVLKQGSTLIQTISTNQDYSQSASQPDSISQPALVVAAIVVTAVTPTVPTDPVAAQPATHTAPQAAPQTTAAWGTPSASRLAWLSLKFVTLDICTPLKKQGIEQRQEFPNRMV